jgi:hypothetical protein
MKIEGSDDMTTPIWQPPAEEQTPPTPPKPKRHWVRWTLAGAGAAVIAFTVIGIAAGGSTTGTPTAVQSSSAAPAAAPAQSAPEVPYTPPASDVLAVGETDVITQDGKDAAYITVTRVSVTTVPADPEFGSAPQNGYYVTAHVGVRTLDNFTGGFSLYSGDFYAKSGSQHFDEGDGNAYDAPGNGQEVGFSNLGAGESATGTLVFDMPSPHGKIAYAPNYDGQALVYWRY